MDRDAVVSSPESRILSAIKSRPAVLLLAAAAGASAVYLADARRREQLRECVTSSVHATREMLSEMGDEWDRARESYEDETVHGPLARLLAGSVGSAIVAIGVAKRRGTVPAAIAGATLLARAVARRGNGDL